MPALRSIDGIQHRQTVIARSSLITVPAAANCQAAPVMPAPATMETKRVSPRPFQLPPASEPQANSAQRFQLPLLIGAGIISGYFVQSLWFGVPAVVLYGILSIIFQVNSRVTFALAFISLLTVPVLLLAKNNVELASNFATYTFLLLVFGVIALSFEARPKSRRRKRRKGR